MSAVIESGNYIIDKEARWDEERELWFVTGGVRTRTGKMILHFMAFGKVAEVAMERAKAYCVIMTAFRPPES